MTIPSPNSSVPPGPSSLDADLIEQARQACVSHRVASEGTDPDSVRVPPEAFDELLQNVIGAVREKVEQLIPFDPHSRRKENFAGWVSRLLAAERCMVERFYLFPSSQENRRQVEKQVHDDSLQSVVSQPVPFTNWGPRAPQIPMNPVWLIDNQTVIRQEPGFGGSGQWLVSRRLGEVIRARALIDEANKRATSAPPHIGPDLTDWMLESAELLQKIAPMSCGKSHIIDPEGCQWYHGYWQYLRLFDMVSSPSWHAAFYADQLRQQIARFGAQRILISGAADYTSLAFVLDAARDRLDGVEVHVTDLCQTPLLACRWYADRLGVNVKTHQADITRVGEPGVPDLDTAESFDLIVADAFLTRFDPDMADQVVSNWSKLLRPGGTVITTVRLHPRNEYADQDALDLEFDKDRRVPDPIDNFELRLRERATLLQDKLPIDLLRLSRAGRKYAKRMVSHDLGDKEAVERLFRKHQFEVKFQTSARVDGELVRTSYVRLTARRPAEPVTGDTSVDGSSD